MMLNAVMCVWNEEDVIESTVKHLFAQGCTNVFIVDNDSTDNTIKNAVNAGAKLAAKFKTKYFNEDQKVAHLNTVVKHINNVMPEEQVWWLYADADEFTTVEGCSIADFLSGLEPSIRAVHGYIYNHLPTHPPYHIQGYHPIDFQPLCVNSTVSKIPLLRYDKGKPHLWSIGGAHDFITHNETIPIVRDCLHIHHFMYRNPAFTFKRLKQLVDKNSAGMQSGDWYKEFSNQIAKISLKQYEDRYKQLQMAYSKSKYLELKTHTLGYDYKSIIRWYDTHEQAPNGQSSYEKNIWLAVYYFFLREYDFAICKLNDIFNNCTDNNIKPWLMMKIAECLADTDISETQNITSYLKTFNNPELNLYIDNYFATRATENSLNKSNAYKVDLYKSEFAAGVAEEYEKIVAKIESNIVQCINKYMLRSISP